MLLVPNNYQSPAKSWELRKVQCPPQHMHGLGCWARVQGPPSPPRHRHRMGWQLWWWGQRHRGRASGFLSKILPLVCTQ